MDVRRTSPRDAACFSPHDVSQTKSSINTPEEDDESMSSSHRDSSSPDLEEFSLFSRQRLDLVHGGRDSSSSFYTSRPLHSPHPNYTQPTPFPSQAPGSAWLQPSVSSCWSAYPTSLPSSVRHKENSSCDADRCESRSKCLSLPGGNQSNLSSLEQPMSLLSNPPSEELRHHMLSPYTCAPMGAPCCAQCASDTFSRPPGAHIQPWAQHQLQAYSPADYRPPRVGFSPVGQSAPVKEKQPSYSMSLSLEQRKVFVTYEADNEKHVNEIINFVALLRHNGFDTHIDIFEQHFRSISTIDFMERYLSEKEYLIIIIISPKYYETVTSSPVALEHDERTFNTVYIHKQLQTEFIHNGSKNFRFIPILFPGAKKSHVPNWLQNTNIYRWPRDQDDILRRLMRVEKYNPPPIGDLPTIVSIPL
ncbi:adapter protein CIKS isoform X2 [Gouania willdenowi]|uniref:adapter protein CIKS isoform X2 n=1 Tax=Gouania willdenowi TaxID=441366 RepID=UPI0010568B68|nr:adapter protein CIKS-like isoform X2 [Gouania willdenowi]